MLFLLATLLVFCACENTIEETSAVPALTQEAEVGTDDISDEDGEGEAAPAASVVTELEPVLQEEQAVPEETAPALYCAMPLPEEMQAMWISFLEWNDRDISTEEALRTETEQMFDNCVSMGLNTVIVAVRPFADALYDSEHYPWSHLVSGAQGTDPGFDPLAVLVELAHEKGLRIEAWLNPYRVQHPEHGPDVLSEDSPAVQNASWVRKQTGLWLDPGLPEVRELVINGVAEIVENYEVDGIHFDDYFYPEGNTSAFDAQTYAQYGEGMELAEWRRQNINEMVKGAYAAVKEVNPSVSFGISPQGNNTNNYNEQHCDINLWMEQPGYADYIMPQLYWGFNYVGSDGNTKAAFNNKTAEWTEYPLHEDVKLYAGLGAYRIGDGDSGHGDQSEWRCGHNLADMVAQLRSAGFSGFALFRYDSLYPPQDSEYAALAAQEVAALTALLKGEAITPAPEGGTGGADASP
ncbi:MAG: glycoside hydrolase family 10 protein [Christensenellaceae bacterium]